jgi:acyl carrier protein
VSIISEAEVRNMIREITKSNVVDKWPVNYDFREKDIDSLDHATLALALEEKYGIKINDAELNNLVSIEAILDFISKPC